MKAKKSHVAWIDNLNNIVDEMVVKPIQVDGNKCALGHFYNSVHLENRKIMEDWNSLGKVHLDFHKEGEMAVDAVERGDQRKARDHYNNAIGLSKTVVKILDTIATKLG